MVFKKFKSNSGKFGYRIFWWKYKGEKKFQAVYLQLFGFIFWIFRDKETYYDWPSQS